MTCIFMNLEILPGALPAQAGTHEPRCSFTKACVLPVLRDGLCAWHWQLLELSLEFVRRINRGLDRVALARQALGLPGLKPEA